GDCVWGTIKDQTEFNNSMTVLFSYVKENAEKSKVIFGGGGYGEPTGQQYFTVYKMPIAVSPEIYSAIQSTHVWFYYPVRWQASDWYDKYTPNTTFQSFLNLIGKIMLWLAVIIAILSPILVIKEFLDKKIE
ncbi:MAG: hypothetical protein AABX66_03770, partial [Nanoarchaeota archaeon]